MSSILTNTSAMVALQTLKNINSSLHKTQDEISTGKTIGSAKDNAAVWAISKVMESDVSGFRAISSSLALGESTVGVASIAAERVTDLLKKMKEQIVASQGENVDRGKIQTEIVALRDQISAIAGGSQFNGLNLLSNREGGATVAQIVNNTGAGAGILGSKDIKVLSSLDRSQSGVAVSNISVTKADLTTAGATAGATAASATTLATGALTVGTAAPAALVGTSLITLVGGGAITERAGHAVLAGDTYQITGLTGLANSGFGAGNVGYVARDGDTLADVAKALSDRVNFFGTAAGVKISATMEASGTAFTITNGTAAALTLAHTVTTGGTASGELELLGKLDVSNENGAKAALLAIEGLIQTATSAATSFGSSIGRIKEQSSFVTALTDSLRLGIGSLVDANMEEASARLQALQVQQQLGVQALSIANQAPQTILSLFR